MKLTSPAEKLLRILVHSIRVRHFDTAHPEHFLGYGEVLEQMELPPTARTGPSDGLTLQMNGMEDLALWLRDQNSPVPAITGLIVSHHDRDLNGNRRNAHVPGSRYFTVFRRSTEDWTWWLNEVRKSLDFDWSRVLPSSVEAPLRTMNSLERPLIEKAGYAHGWENVRESTPERVVMYSARHKAESHVTPTATPMVWHVTFPNGPPSAELIRSLPGQHTGGDAFQATDEASLGRLLRRAAELAMSLPNQAAEQYAAEIAKLDANPPSTTEVLALIKQRRGQDLFRKALMDYWGGACAVTGIAIPELLRASHTIPWAKCDNDEERLNIFNGFLLCAHLDALFDKGLMTFNFDGSAILSCRISSEVRASLLLNNICLRWISALHLPFLEWHREHIFLN